MRFYLFFVFLLVFTSNIVLGQQKKQEVFEGSFFLKEHEEGKVRYGFYRNEDDEKVFHGNFSFSSENLDSLDNFFQRKITGTYADGLKNEKWVYQNNIFKINISTVNDRFQVQSTADGIVQKLEASYKDGKAVGIWRLEEHKVESSQQKDRKILMIANFEDGRMIDNFLFDGYLHGNKTKVTGRFSKDQFFDGEWEFSYTKDSAEFYEKRVYDNGFLTSILQKDLTNNVSFHDIELTRVEKKLSNVKRGLDDIDYTIGKDFFGVGFDDGFPFFSEEAISQKYGNDVLNEIFSLFIEREYVAGLDLDGIEKLRPGGTRRFEYTFTGKEKEALEESETLLANYTSDLEKFVNNTTLSLNRQKTDSLSFSFRLAQNILNNFKILEDNIELLKSESFKYQSKRTYYRSGIEGIEKVDTVRYTFDGEERKRIIENPVDFSISDDVVFNIRNYVQAKGKIVDQLDLYFKDMIIEIERDMVSQQLEEDLINSIQKVSDTYDIERGVEGIDEEGIVLTRFHVSMYQNYQRKLDLMMQEYSTVEGFEDKQEKGLEIINMAQTYYEAYYPIGEVRKRLQQLDEAYTKISYNPYMDRHDIKTRVKRNIYFAAVDYLLPDYRERIINVDDFRELPDLIDEMNDAFDSLIEIANKPDSETRSMERRLRRESNPSRIKRIIDL
ncbi:hypothetical protein [Mongoliibacter ruber]|uniref:Uncharacterized protein n=1 Tax=Mongoliibacter ruber TaxID=1750599 RepID=A0A2T0WG73_9BACT|nr:hypothetical protein [Mongoliibacter ruber]PRY85699.1 hypothetical protein CLW00_11141 [Mongoliibacter ruber]